MALAERARGAVTGGLIGGAVGGVAAPVLEGGIAAGRYLAGKPIEYIRSAIAPGAQAERAIGRAYSRRSRPIPQPPDGSRRASSALDSPGGRDRRARRARRVIWRARRRTFPGSAADVIARLDPRGAAQSTALHRLVPAVVELPRRALGAGGDRPRRAHHQPRQLRDRHAAGRLPAMVARSGATSPARRRCSGRMTSRRRSAADPRRDRGLRRLPLADHHHPGRTGRVQSRPRRRADISESRVLGRNPQRDIRRCTRCRPRRTQRGSRRARRAGTLAQQRTGHARADLRDGAAGRGAVLRRGECARGWRRSSSARTSTWRRRAPRSNKMCDPERKLFAGRLRLAHDGEAIARAHAGPQRRGAAPVGNDPARQNASS